MLTKGSGKNHWNAKGFRLKLTSPAYGAFNVSYSQKTQKLTGTGGNPSCAPGVTWKLGGEPDRHEHDQRQPPVAVAFRCGGAVRPGA